MLLADSRSLERTRSALLQLSVTSVPPAELLLSDSQSPAESRSLAPCYQGDSLSDSEGWLFCTIGEKQLQCSHRAFLAAGCYCSLDCSSRLCGSPPSQHEGGGQRQRTAGKPERAMPFYTRLFIPTPSGLPHRQDVSIRASGARAAPCHALIRGATRQHC
jgi:hypothetical protein